MAVRRIFGSTPAGILKLYSSEFSKWIIISLIIAWPVSYVIINKWLQNFIYHTNIGAFAFVFSSAMAIIISAFSAGSHLVKSAFTNPAQSLRNK